MLVDVYKPDKSFLLVLDSCRYGKVPLRYSIVCINADKIYEMLSARKQC